VRYITNRSSGKQGYALAQAALDAGADVVLVSATGHLPTPVGAALIQVDSAAEMHRAVEDHIQGAAALIMAAAVADFRPSVVAEQKIKKTEDDDAETTLSLSRTVDILLAVKGVRARTRWPCVVVGFAAESQALLENAASKLERKGLDLIIANDITAADAGFEADTNRVTILDAHGGQQALGLASKTAVSEIIINRVADLLADR
jgi:phosphopantothenoylcysteine decarboxylase/phosphopantothenate--cysteine ligase